LTFVGDMREDPYGRRLDYGPAGTSEGGVRITLWRIEVFSKRAASMALTALLLAGPTGTVQADPNLRCGNRLVSVGDSQADVLDRCGQPDARSQWQHGGYVSRLFDPETESYRAPKLLKGPVSMERWTYDFGPNMFIRRLVFENGRLIEIETSEKGSR
jgi:hypothetical protein